MNTEKARKYWHMNFCVKCKRPFELRDNVDLCEKCKVIYDIHNGEYQGDEEIETQPEIIVEIMRRYMQCGYE